MKRQNELISSAQKGSIGAFEQLVVDLEPEMLSLAAGLAAYPDEADDIYQESVFNAYKALPKFRSDSQFSTWFYRIIVNTALDYKRKLSHQFSRRLTHEDNQVDEFEYYGNPSKDIENTQLSHSIHQALKMLSEKERVAFVLCHQQELIIADAAQIMECTEGSVKSYLFRARSKLRDLLQEYKR
ncbi:RNA polymerase sigma factor [Agarilytica rhodophyticola]|uniref:RNA polymerase sigma factor n=1 Tax=Agarilytica rhodophyticola TaxID=1737490 RepID=UPI00131A2A2C|nr:RNA polymerase sigma factor [Agarilytica rhodophyticola]